MTRHAPPLLSLNKEVAAVNGGARFDAISDFSEEANVV